MKESLKELEKRLASAKLQEQKEVSQKELENIRKEYEGKAFGSREFDRASRAGGSQAIYIKSVFMKGNDIYAEILSITYSSNLMYWHDRSCNTEKISDNGRSADYNIYNRFSFLKKEITKEKFMQLWLSCEVADKHIRKAFVENVEPFHQDVITQGDYDRETNIEKGIKAIGLNVVDVRKHLDREFQNL